MRLREMPLLYVYMLLVLSLLFASSNKVVDEGSSSRRLVNLNGRPVEDLRPLNQVQKNRSPEFSTSSANSFMQQLFTEKSQSVPIFI